MQCCVQNPHTASQKQTDINDIILRVYKNTKFAVLLIYFDGFLNTGIF